MAKLLSGSRIYGNAVVDATLTSGNLAANSNVASTSTTTGALRITGGAGISGNVYVGGDIVTSGNLTINGTTTNINTTNLVVEDKNIIIADVATPTNVTADGAGITVKGSTDKTFNWVSLTAAWTSSEDLDLLTGKQYEINGTSVLTATTLGSGVVNSSLTSVGTITSLVATTAVATNFSSGNIRATNSTAGTWSTANVSLYESVTASTTNATFYPILADKTAGNTGGFSAVTLTHNPSTGNLTATGHVGNFWGPVAATTANVSSTLAVTGTSAFTGATNHAGGITASTVSAGTIGNAGATLTGTLSTASQPNITTLAGVTSIGASGATTLTGILQTAAQTNITSVGTLTGLTVSGNIVPNANLTVNIGSVGTWFNTFFGVSTQAKYADLAENYQADALYEPGTVLVFGGAREVTTTDQDHNTAVAGIVSTNPAHLMNGMLTGPGVVALGLTGRVPCRVQGPVAKGDVLVTSTTPGVAQRIDNAKFLPGCVVGKALEAINTNTIQTIEVVVGRF